MYICVENALRRVLLAGIETRVETLLRSAALLRRLLPRLGDRDNVSTPKTEVSPQRHALVTFPSFDEDGHDPAPSLGRIDHQVEPVTN